MPTGTVDDPGAGDQRGTHLDLGNPEAAPVATRVVNIQHAHCEVYVGRPGPYGNPFAPQRGKAYDRTDAIAKHAAWLKTQPDLIAEVRRTLKGKTLGCWCKPKPCHGDILARVADMTEAELLAWRAEPEPVALPLCLDLGL